MNNLPEIRDIHIPDGVSIFPLAYGWWFVLAIVIVCVICVWAVRRAIKTSRKYYAIKTLSLISVDNPVTAAIKISELLKRICISKYKTASALYGKDWVDFLNSHTTFKLDNNAADLLIYAPFIGEKSRTYITTDAEKLKHFAKIWIGENL